MNGHQDMRASRYYKQVIPCLHPEHMMDMTATAARLPRQLEVRRREQREWQQSIRQGLTRMREQRRLGGPMLALQATIQPS